MDTCYITSLPIELLYKIAASYRVWKLLQMTCRRVNLQLRDYHTHVGMCFIKDDDRTISYDDFVYGLIDSMTEYERIQSSDEYCICTNCSWITNAGEEILDSYDVIARWSSGCLSLEGDEDPIAYMERGESYERWNIGDIIMCSVVHYTPKGLITLLYEFIYNELPLVYTKMSMLVPLISLPYLRG